MSLTKSQFNRLVGLVVEKILYTPGLEGYIEDNPGGDFSLKCYGKVGVYYKCGKSMVVDLPWLANSGDTLPSFERCEFVKHLLTSLRELVEKSKAQRESYQVYKEQIESL